MLRRLCLALPVATCLAAAGCSTTYSFKEFSPSPSSTKTALVDIKQRAILSSQRKNGSEDTLILCAEPSPDALSSISSELAADVKYKELLATTLSLASQEAASFVGLRTQTIQLLRDGMYRLCEGYMSGAISAPDYAWLMRRYQKYMVALLTIEQLTRVTQAPVVAQASRGTAAAARSAAAIQSELEEIDKTILRLKDENKTLEAEKIEFEKLDDEVKSKETNKNKAQSRIDANQSALTRAHEIRSALLEGLKSAKGVLVSGSTFVNVSTGTPEQREMVSDTIAKAIREIALEVLGQEDLGTMCFQILDGSRVSNIDPAIKSSCSQVVKARADTGSALASAAQKWLIVIDKISDKDPEKAASLLEEFLSKNKSVLAEQHFLRESPDPTKFEHLR